MKYALVTGATSGIGLEYARELASRGYHIIAVSNDREGLKRVAQDIYLDFNVSISGIYSDLSREEAAKEIFDMCEAQGFEVEILICNAGALLFSTLANTPTERIGSLINLHCTTPTLLCRYFGQKMKERGYGNILIMSSATAWLPYPTISVYGATKAYLKNFAFSLWQEMYRYGVNVTAVFPGAVDTPFYNLDEGKRTLLTGLGLMHSPATIARRGLRALFSGRRRLIPGLLNKLIVLLCSILPARLLELITRLKPLRELLERL